MSAYDYVLLGGGVACVTASKAIRGRDDAGTVLILDGDPHPPYDRPPLSKKMLADPNAAVDDPYSKFDNYYPDNRIDLWKSVRATAVDRGARTVTLSDGRTVSYGKLLIATGSHAVRPRVPGADRPGVHTLRTLEESLALRDAIGSARRMVVVGGGFLGLEAAASAHSRGVHVTVIEREPRLWPRATGPAAGACVQAWLSGQGIDVRTGISVARFDGESGNGRLRAVTLSDGSELSADLALVAVGAAMNLEAAQSAGLAQPEGIPVDTTLRSEDPAVWAAGDVAWYLCADGKRRRHEHHLHASWTGDAAGANMAGADQPYTRVPYFFSDVGDIHQIVRGSTDGTAAHAVTGSTEAGEFVELHLDEAGRLLAGVAISHTESSLDPISDALEDLVARRVMVRGMEAAIAGPTVNLAPLTGAGAGGG